jgi:membrane-associated phospholipid phosphatase
MSAAFLITYGGSLRITAARAPVPTLAFAWERYTPFVPALILPYWSIDLFFVGSFFLCTRVAELPTHVKRLALAMVIATACFLLFPLQMANPRPVVEGFWSVGFTPLHALDQPYNLAPSLHIALWTILLAVYVRHTRAWLRLALLAWFALIYVSTLLTWQHQLFDVITGQALGLLALYLFRERERSTVE